MSGIRLLHRVNRKRPDGIYAEAIEPLFFGKAVCGRIALRIRC
jgi:hypothetical protein